MTAGIFSFLGVIVGALITAAFSWHNSKREQEIYKEKSLYDATRESSIQAQSVVNTKKIDAAEIVWKSTLDFRRAMPPIIGPIDFLTSAELDKMMSGPEAEETRNFDAMKAVIDLSNLYQPVDYTKLYLDNKIWLECMRFRAISCRLVLFLPQKNSILSKKEWHKDDTIRKMVESSLGKDALNTLDEHEFGKIGWLLGELELKILSLLKEFIGAEKLDKENLARAKKLQDEIVNIERGRITKK